MLGPLLALSAGIDWVSERIGRLMGWVAVALVVLGVVNVVGRYLGARLGVQLGSNTLLEAQTYAYNLMFLLAAAYVLLRDQHIRVDILYTRFGPRARAWVDILGASFFLIPFCLLALWFGYGYVERAWVTLEVSPNPGGLPRYPIKTVILVAFVMLLLQGVSEIIKRTAWLRGVPGVPGPGGVDPVARGGGA
jgi:TRAP-type mannitol/chloroaromatic compound transport system permease small subunit